MQENHFDQPQPDHIGQNGQPQDQDEPKPEKLIDQLLEPLTAEEHFEKGLYLHGQRLRMDKEKGTAIGLHFCRARQEVRRLLGPGKWKAWVREKYKGRISYAMVHIYEQLQMYRELEGVKEAGSISVARKHFPKKIRRQEQQPTAPVAAAGRTTNGAEAGQDDRGPTPQGLPEPQRANFNAPLPSYVKMCQLYLTVNSCPVFQGWVEAIGYRYGVSNFTDVVYRVVEWAYSQLCRDEQGTRPAIPFPVPGAKDYRRPEHRLEAFTKSFLWQVLTGDLDDTHAHRVIADALRWGQGARAWYSLLYGQTYRPVTAALIANQFPDPLTPDPAEFAAWFEKNKGRLPFGKDTRKNQRQLPAVVAGIREWANREGHRDLGTAFRGLAGGGTADNFRAVYGALRGLRGYGRMTAWLTMQALHDTMRLDINHPDLLLAEDNNAVFNGLCRLFDREGLTVGKGGKPSAEALAEMNGRLAELVAHLGRELPFMGVDIFRLESHLCEFGKWFTGGTYPGLRSMGANASYADYKAQWPEANLQFMLKAQLTLHPSIRGLGPDARLKKTFASHGVIPNLHDLDPTEPDVYAMLGIDKAALVLPDLAAEYTGRLSQHADRYAPARWEEYKGDEEREKWLRWAGLDPAKG